jgi:hypothetical protein
VRAKALRAFSISAALRVPIGLTSIPSDGATDWITANWPMPAVVAESRITATRIIPGAICLSSSAHFALRLYSNCMKPVTLPPGLDRLVTKPLPSGSTAMTKTTGTA